MSAIRQSIKLRIYFLIFIHSRIQLYVVIELALCEHNSYILCTYEGLFVTYFKIQSVSKTPIAKVQCRENKKIAAFGNF